MTKSTYKPSERDLAKLEQNFTYHAPKFGQGERYTDMRKQAYDLAHYMLHNCPDSRELSLAITKLEESMMWANASIARNE